MENNAKPTSATGNDRGYSARRFVFTDYDLQGNDSVVFAACDTPNGVSLINMKYPRDIRWMPLRRFEDWLGYGDIVEVFE